MIEFLEADPAKAKAWVDVQNADPLLRWDQTLTDETLGDYLRSLTPATLAADTLVTNHSYGNGVDTHVSLLQAGTAVLVDAYGVPRAKCYCGNPLTPAPPLEGDFELDEDSDPWPDAGRDGTRPNPDPGDPTTDIRQNTCDAFRRSNVPSDEWPPRCRPAPGAEPSPTASPTASPEATPSPEPEPSPTATAVPAPTATPDPGTAPTLTFVEQTENPGETGCDGLRPVQLTISYSDADGDAIGTVLQSGTDAGGYSTITGDGSSGTITVGQCIGSPATLEFTLVDQAGNESAVLGIPVA